MKKDIIAWSLGLEPGKIITKETLNHPGIIAWVSGLDVYAHTAQAYRTAYAALGIDIINRVPLHNAPAPTGPGKSRHHHTRPYIYQPLGVFDTAYRHHFECASVDEAWKLDVERLQYDDLITPVPHPCRGEDICQREAFIGDVGMYYPMLYTTLFMWGVEVFGWEIFMEAAFTESDRFHEHFLEPCAKKSISIVEEMAVSSTAPFVFLHDDLASASGPVFPPSWYEEYIFPHYKEIFEPAKRSGKKIIFVADGNISTFLPRLAALGVDGIMFESPATPLEPVMEHFGGSGKFFIGGIASVVLSRGTPRDVQAMVHELAASVETFPGFAMASGGGLHGDIPLENLIGYFDARADVGATPKEWKRLRSSARRGIP